MIEVRNIFKSFDGKPVVKGISFSVEKGKTLVLLGTSGCGKTTTLKMINRLIEADKGEILINGTPTSHEDPVQLRRKIGYVIQKIGLFPHFTVRQNIATVPQLLKWDQERIDNKTKQLLELVNLDPANSSIDSHMNFQAAKDNAWGLPVPWRAEPEILLMDEPFGALDPITREEIRRDFKRIEEFRSKTTVLVTHDVTEAIELGDQICLMDAGHIVQSGKPEELVFKPVNDFARKFFDMHRLEMEFSIIRIKDCLPFMEAPGTKGDPIIQLEDPMTVLEFFSAYMDREGPGGFRIGNEGLTFDSSSLFQAFLKFRASMHA